MVFWNIQRLFINYSTLGWQQLEYAEHSHRFCSFPHLTQRRSHINSSVWYSTAMGSDKKVECVTTDKGSDIEAAVKYLTSLINNINSSCRQVEDIHIRCIAHFHLATKNFLHLVHEKIKIIRDPLSIIRSSVKRRHTLDMLHMQSQCGLSNKLPSSDVEKRWSSTISMIQNAYSQRFVLNSITGRVETLR